MMTENSNEPIPAQPTAWDLLLLVLLAVVAVYAAALIVAGDVVDDTLFGPLGFGLDEDTTTTAAEHVRLLRGVLGAVLMGWLVLLAAVVVGPLRRREPWAWPAIACSLAAWFIADTTFSLVVGAWEHGLFNLGFAVALSVPLAGIRRSLPHDHG